MKPFVLALAGALAAGTIAPASAQEPPPAAMTADDLIARGKAVEDAGLHPLAEREDWSARYGGLDGSLTVSRRGEDSVTDTTMGPFRTAHGVWHGQKWHQNDNGETILDRPEPSQTERVLTQTVTRVREPVDAWSLTTTYASGHVTRFFYDPRTFEIVRSEKTIAGRTSHVSYDDFRTDAHGRTRFWHYFGGDDRADNDFDYRLLRDDVGGDVTEADVAIARDRRTLVEFPAGNEVVRLPARIENDRIYVRVDIAGRGLDFLLDTGAATLSINGEVARELKLTEYGRTTQTVAGTFTTGRIVVPEMTIGPLVMRDVVLHTVPIASNEAHDTRVVGLLGFDFLDALALRIDYANGVVNAARPGTLPAPGGATPLEVRLNSLVPIAHAALGDAAGDDFILDTGAAFSYVVFQRFTRAHPDAFSSIVDARSFVGEGVGGSMPYRRLPNRRIELGTWAFDDDAGAEALSPNALGFDNEDGLIGADILKNFTLDLDYAAGRIYLMPNGRDPAIEAVAPQQPSRPAVDDFRSNTTTLRPFAPVPTRVPH